MVLWFLYDMTVKINSKVQSNKTLFNKNLKCKQLPYIAIFFGKEQT